MTTGGGVQCWGRNFWGQLGGGTTTDSAVPLDVVGLASGVAAVSAGSDYTCALTTGGAVKCWGSNEFGQLGDGAATDRTTPVDVMGFAAVATPIPGVSPRGLVVVAALHVAFRVLGGRLVPGLRRAP